MRGVRVLFQQSGRPHGQKEIAFFIRTALTGLAVLVSTTPIALQDAVGLLDGTPGQRGQAHLIADRADGDFRSVAVSFAVDPVTTGAIPADATPLGTEAVNRSAKADLERIRPRYVQAGLLAAGVLQRPFNLLAGPESHMAQVAAFSPSPWKADAPATAVAAAPAADAPVQVAAIDPDTAVSAYANPDDTAAVEAPFQALLGQPARPGPDPTNDHWWVANPIPVNARSATEQKCLADAIYFEARGEPAQGQLAVAQVVINRLKNPAYPNTICGVVYQNRQMRNRCQFSFACDGIRDVVHDRGAWAQAQEIARKVVYGEAEYLTEVGSATHYHATYVRPRWARSMIRMKRIGHHVFYKTYGGGWM